MRRDPNKIVYWIIYVNIGIYLVSLVLDPRAFRFDLNPLTFLSPTYDSLAFLGATGADPISKFHRWWSLLSANYLHGSLLHIFFNMAALRQLGPLISQLFGPYRMFTIYTLGGVAGFFVSYMAGVPFTIGASAALCSLIGAALYYGKSRGGAFGQAVFKQVVSWVIGIALIGLIPSVNNWGHGGGILAGILIGFLLGYHERKPETLKHNVFAGVCALTTLMTIAWMLFIAILVIPSIYAQFFKASF